MELWNYGIYNSALSPASCRLNNYPVFCCWDYKTKFGNAFNRTEVN